MLAAFCPMMGANYHRIGIVDRRWGSSSLELIEGVKGNVVEIGIVHGSLPSFRSCSGGETLRAAITHYKAIAVLQVTMSIKCCPKGVPGPSYIGGQT